MAEAQPGEFRTMQCEESGSCLAAPTEMFILMTLRFMPYRVMSLPRNTGCQPGDCNDSHAFGQIRETGQSCTRPSPYPGTVVEDVVARVNDQVISRSDYERAAQDLEAQAKQQQWTQQQLYEQKHELLRDLIDQQLLHLQGQGAGHYRRDGAGEAPGRDAQGEPSRFDGRSAEGC